MLNMMMSLFCVSLCCKMGVRADDTSELVYALHVYVKLWMHREH